MVCSLFRPWPWLRLYARFYQAEPAPVVGTAKHPESLCLMLVLPSSGRRVPPVRGVCAGCYQTLLPPGSSRRYLYESFPGCLSPYPGGPAECSPLVLPQRLRPSPRGGVGRRPASAREHDFPRLGFRGCSYFFMLQGRTMARNGLRMMPPFPWSPLKFRTVSLPQYGFKAGLSDGTFPVAPISRHPHAPSSFADDAGLRPGLMVSALPTPPSSDSHGETQFRENFGTYLRFAFATTCRFVRPPCRS
jgi:hypothetical protein